MAKGIRAPRIAAISSIVSGPPGSRRAKLRGTIRRNRVLLVTLLAVAGVIALLTGISLAQGAWYPNLYSQDIQPPRPRFGAGSTFDEARNELVLFGGFVGTGAVPGTGATVATPPIVTDGETWIFRGSFEANSWGIRHPIHQPSARGFASMAYDRARRNVVLFGGAPYNTNNVSGETWIWDGEDWALQSPPEPLPEPRQNASMVYDAHRKVVLMFGGRGANGAFLNDTWTWNGSRWSIKPSEGAPSPRHSAAIAYNPCRAEAVMFGGIGDKINNFTPQPGETWTWNGTKWSQQTPKVSPPPRIGASMAYSPRTGTVLMYGGITTNDAGVPTAAGDPDVWRLIPNAPDPIGGTWERMSSEAGVVENFVLAFALGDGRVRTHPAPRAYASFLYTKEGGSYGSTFNLFAGTPSVGASGAQLALGDQFEFGDAALFTGAADQTLPFVGNTPLTLKCFSPVPVPPDDAAGGQVAAPEGPKVEVREGMREIGQLRVLTGTDWPAANRNSHNYGNPPKPNPNYIPPPDCPNRSSEVGWNTRLFTDPNRNRVFQFFPCDPDRGYGNVGGYYQRSPSAPKVLFEAYDGTTLKPLGRVLIPNIDTTYGQVIHDVDRGRFLVRSSYWNGSTTISALLDIRQNLIEKSVDPVISRTADPGLDLRTLFSHPKTGRAKIFRFVAGASSPVPGQSTPPKLIQWDLEDQRQDWIVNLTGCEFVETLAPAMRSEGRAYTLCKASGRNSVARIAVTENADGSETPGSVEVFLGPPYAGAVWADAQTERMLIYDGVTYVVWVFDGKSSRWVGRSGIGIGAGANYGVQWGFDKDAGRLYAHMADSIGGYHQKYSTQGGALILDTRLTPVAQPVRFPQFAFPPGSPVAFLPSEPGVPRRVFIRQTAGTVKKYPNAEPVKFDNQMFYRVLADELPVPKITDLSELDALTVPVAEAPGKTEVSFDAEGSSYGIRLRSVGGVWSVARPFYDGSNDQWENILLNGAVLPVRPYVPGCVFPDRELMAGWVPQAHLSDLDALARSTGLDVDSNSKVDLDGPFSRCNPSAGASNLPPTTRPVFDVLWPLWQMVQFEGNKAVGSGTVEAGKDADGNTTRTDTPAGTLEVGQDQGGKPTVRLASPVSSGWDSHFHQVECVGDALATNQATVGNIYGSANCVQRQGRVEAAARGSATGAGPASSATSSAGFSVGEGYSTVVVTRDTVKGVVVTSTAVARGIQLPGVSQGGSNVPSLSIDRVETKAIAWSNGRPGEERAIFTRIICGIHTPDGSIPGCLTAQQQNDFVARWNSGWGGTRSQMFLPKPDPDYYQGSPGGYIAGVIKPVNEEIEDQIFAKDYQREVPGLVIEFYKNSVYEGNARQSLMLAGVRAVAGLGVQCNPDLLYSPQAKECLALADDPSEEEFFEEEDEEEFEDADLELDGEWTPVEATGINGESIGKKIGRFIQGLPIISRLPIREIGEALLAWSVWLLLAIPLLLAWRRMTLNLGGTK